MLVFSTYFWFCNKQVHVRRFLESFSIDCNSLAISFSNRYLPEMSSPSRCLKLARTEKFGILSVTEILISYIFNRDL